MMMNIIGTILAAITLLASPAVAWPTGAGACPKGEPAVMGAHIENANTVTGALEDSPQELQVLLNGAVLSSATAASLSVNEPAEVQVLGGSAFKGFLVRLGPTDASAMTERTELDLTTALSLISDDAADVKLEEMYCIPLGVAGVCHTANDAKTKVMATLEIEEAMELVMDVTVVIANNANMSEYYHTSYMINAVGAGIAPPVEDETGATAAPAAVEDENSVTPAPASTPGVESGSIMMVASGLVMAASVVIVTLVL